MKRGLSVLVVCLVVLGSSVVPAVAAGTVASPRASIAVADAGAAPAADGATDPRGSISVVNVSTEPTEPYPGQSLRFEVTVENDGRAPVKVSRIEVVPEDTNKFTPDTVYGAIEDRGTLDPGERETIVFEQEKDDARLKKPGIHRLRANATAETRDPTVVDNETVEDSKRFTMEVKPWPERPTVTIDGGENMIADGKSGTATVTVRNTADIPLKNAELRFVATSQDLLVQDQRRFAGKIGAGQTREFTFNLSTDTPGDKLVQVEMRYETYGGRENRTVANENLAFFKDPNQDTDGDGIPDTDDDCPNEEEDEDGDEDDDGCKEKDETTETNETPANLSHSRISTEMENGKVHISGTIGNGGDLPANGVELAVVEAEGVEPAQPNPRYFVDEGISPDETKDFDLYAKVDPNVSTVTVEVSFRTNNTTRSKSFDVDVSNVNASTGTDGSDGSDQGGGYVGSILILVVVGVVGVVWYRRRSGDDDGDAPVSPDAGDGPTGPGDDTALGAGDGGAAGELSPGGRNQGGRNQGGRAGQLGPGEGRQRGGRQQGGPGVGGQSGRGQGQPGHGQPGQPGQQGQPGPGETPGHGHGQGRTGQGQHTHQGGAAGGAPGGSQGNQEVRCDGCGKAFAADSLGTIALTEGETAHTCHECQVKALEAAKDELGADDSDDEGGVGDLVSAMSEQPTCDGCDTAVPEDDLEEMTLPDGSVAMSCSSCREAALEAAKEEIMSDEGGDHLR